MDQITKQEKLTMQEEPNKPPKNQLTNSQSLPLMQKNKLTNKSGAKAFLSYF